MKSVLCGKEQMSKEMEESLHFVLTCLIFSLFSEEGCIFQHMENKGKKAASPSSLVRREASLLFTLFGEIGNIFF